MKRFLTYVAYLLAALVVLAAGAFFWFHHKAIGRYEKAWTSHTVDFPIPFPLSEDDLAMLRTERVASGASVADPLAGVDLEAAARDHAVARGKYLVESRVACYECHGKDFGGAAVIDSPLIGTWVAPNLTTGKGSVTSGFTPADWDRAVRHGIRHNGMSSSMPSEEFVNLADHELSDVVSYIRSMPPVDRDLGGVVVGPLFSYLAVTDPKIFVAYTLDHNAPHRVEPPNRPGSAEAGEHIVQVCRGCHGPTLSGGQVAGDPNMPTVANITPHESGLKGWTEADFFRALREGKRRDGTAISTAMPWQAYGNMSDDDIKAVWTYLKTVSPVAKGNH